MKQISSRDNPTFKALRDLVEDARAQREQGRTLIDGLHLLETYQQRGGIPVQLLLAESAQDNPHIVHLSGLYPQVETLLLRDSLFRELSGVAAPTGIAALIAIPAAPTEIPRTSCVLLDAVQDAGNVGSILRSAAAAGIRDVVLGKGCAGVWTPRVLRAAQGAHFSLKLHEQADLAALLPALAMPGIATVATGGTPLHALDLRQDVAWLFGNEGAGLSADLISAAALHATIPLAAQTESLNVAAAAAICLFEAVRQRS